MTSVYKKYPLANKIREINKPFEQLEIDVRFRKNYQEIISGVEEVNHDFEDLVSTMISKAERGAYPSYKVSAGVKAINLIYDTIVERKTSGYIAKKLAAFEKEHAVMFKVEPRDRFIYLEADPQKFFVSSVADALQTIVGASTDEQNA